MNDSEKPQDPARRLGYDDLSLARKRELDKALRHGVTRRELMGWLMAAGATASGAGTMLLGARDALAATPKRGGNVRFGWELSSPGDTLDPILFTSSLDYGRGRLNYNSLTRFNEDLTVGPELATSWGEQRRRNAVDVQASQGCGVARRLKVQRRRRRLRHDGVIWARIRSPRPRCW